MPAPAHGRVGQDQVGAGVGRLFGPWRVVEQGPVLGVVVRLDPELHAPEVQVEGVLVPGLDGHRWRLHQRLPRQVGQPGADEGLGEGPVLAVQQGEVGVQDVVRGQMEDGFDLAAPDLCRCVEQGELAGGGAGGQVHRHDVVVVVVVECLGVDLDPPVHEPVLAADGVGCELLRIEVGQQADLGAEVEAALQIAGRYVGVDQRGRRQIEVDARPPVDMGPGRAWKVVRRGPDRERKLRDEYLVLARRLLGVVGVAQAAGEPQPVAERVGRLAEDGPGLLMDVRVDRHR